MRILKISAMLAVLIGGSMTCTCQRGSESASGQVTTAPTTAPTGSAGDAAEADEGGSGESEPEPVNDQEESSPAARLQPDHFHYQGAFRLPDEFSWGARGMSYRPGEGAGTLLVTGFELARTVDGESCQPGPDCVALYGEVRIPQPVVSENVRELPRAEQVRPVTGFDGGLMRQLDQHTWVSGIEFVPGSGEGQLYGSLDLWYAEGARGIDTFPTVWVSELDGSDPRGLFHVGPERPPFHGRKMGDYLFSVPRWYADRYLGGRTLMIGRARGTPVGTASETTRGGSQGPTFFAFHPLESGQSPSHLDALPVLYYRTRFPGCAGPNVGDPDSCDFPGYTMCDIWTGADFIEGGSGRAILLAGLKGLGSNCYDAQPNPPECNDPCSDGSTGYHCHPYERQVLFYDVEELAQAAQGEVEPWTVLHYGIWRPSELFLDGEVCGTMGGMSFDPASRRLYMIERGLISRNTNAAAVHVWEVR